MQVAALNSFTRVLNLRGGVYVLSSTDSFILSQLLSVARHVDAWSWDQNLPNFTLDLISSPNHQIYTKNAKQYINNYKKW